MPTSTLIDIISASTGILGSLFFANGVMRQSVAAMADLSGTYWDWNPHMVPALAAQKADYLFGGGLIVVAFALQLAAFLVPPASQIPFANSAIVPWTAAAVTVGGFFVLRILAQAVAKRFEAQINARLQEKNEEIKRKHADKM